MESLGSVLFIKLVLCLTHFSILLPYRASMKLSIKLDMVNRKKLTGSFPKIKPVNRDSFNPFK
jgi:hypothetical protein